MALPPNEKVYVAEDAVTGISTSHPDKITAVRELISKYPNVSTIVIYETIKDS